MSREFSLFNTLSRTIEPLRPLAPPQVTLYVCGPTIYNYGHIGNFRTYLAVDLLRRTLQHFGYQVRHVMQFTDVDDKTIKGAREKLLPLRTYTGVYRQAFLEDAATLNLLSPEKTPNATDHIPGMVTLIQTLMEKKAAYLSEDGSVYFRISAFPAYGCLCHLDLQNLKVGARVNQDDYEKEGIGDFVLWKKWTEADGEVAWPSPWGQGRPGWHIECSALSMEFLGPEIDLHGGGTDLRFPHHENELAQSEAATGRPFVRHWFHVEHLLVDGQKMSKSSGNMHTVRDIAARGYSGRELRYALLSGAHYRKNLNFTGQSMDDTRAALLRIDEWRKRIADLARTAKESVAFSLSTAFLDKINHALADDLNLSDALGHLFQLIRETNKLLDAQKLSPAEANHVVQTWQTFDQILGLGEATRTIPPEVQELLEQRLAARQTKNFAQSDDLRQKIEGLGWKVKDTAQGQELLPI